MQKSYTAGHHDIRIQCLEPGSGSPAHSVIAEENRRPALLILHGAGGNSAFWLDRLAPYAAEAGLAIYAPHYFDRTGTTRADYTAISDGVHVPQWLEAIDAGLRWVASRPGVDPQRIGVVGVSLGAFLSLGLAARLSASSDGAERDRIRCLIDVSGGLVEPYAAQATRHFPPTLLLHGEEDTIVAASHARELDGRLSALGVPHDLRILPGEGHWFSSSAQLTLLLAAAGFLQKHLAPAATLAR
jgi:carboxymethylenebutenolidase